MNYWAADVTGMDKTVIRPLFDYIEVRAVACIDSNLTDICRRLGSLEASIPQTSSTIIHEGGSLIMRCVIFHSVVSPRSMFMIFQQDECMLSARFWCWC